MNNHEAGREPDDWMQRAIDEHEDGLRRYAQHFVGDINRARDVVQDTFLKLCHYNRDHSRLAGSSQTKWLFKVCRNRAIDISRKEKRMKLAPSDQFEDRLSADGSSPEAVALQQEREADLLAQISRLPPNQQEVLRLKFHGDLSYQEIAEVTGLTRTNVGFLLHQAITRLRQRVAAKD